jgi:hypothetical protein
MEQFLKMLEGYLEKFQLESGICITKLVIKWNDKRTLEGASFCIGDIGFEALSIERK